MKKVKLECTVSYTVDFDCEVEVADDVLKEGGRELTSAEIKKIKEQVEEAAKEHDSMLDVDDVDWFVA